MSTNPLTPAQHFILAAAIEHTDGRIERFPDNIKGGARRRESTVPSALFNHDKQLVGIAALKASEA